MNRQFIIISPCYMKDEDQTKYYIKHLESVKAQTYSNYEHLVIDDASPFDGMDYFNQFKGLKSNIIRKNYRRGCVHSHILPFLKCVSLKEDVVIVHLDADDWFADKNVLERLNEVYDRHDPWVTYGDYKTTDETPSINRPLSDLSFRQSIRGPTGWSYSHLRTFVGNLIFKIPYTYLLDIEGNLLSHAADTVIFLPILEMAGRDRVHFCEDINVVYNRSGRNEDSTTEDMSAQVSTALLADVRPPLERLDHV